MQVTHSIACLLQVSAGPIIAADQAGTEVKLLHQAQLVRSSATSTLLPLRLLAALPHLQHLWLAGNPVTAGMNPREQRAFIVDLMPGTETLQNSATGPYDTVGSSDAYQ